MNQIKNTFGLTMNILHEIKVTTLMLNQNTKVINVGN